MKFEAAVEAVPVLHALKRIASAHVVDYSRLGSDDLRANILRTIKQYTHPEATPSASFNNVSWTPLPRLFYLVARPHGTV